MKVAFADASFYVALFIPRDVNHGKAKSLASSWTGKVVTIEYVLTEVANHLAGSPRRRAQFAQLLTDLEADANTTIIESSHDLWKRGGDFFCQRSDKNWSLTDCTSFVVMQDLGLNEALTADHHFEQAGFVALLLQ